MARRLITSRGKQVRIEGLQELHNNIANLMSRSVGQEVKHIWMTAAMELRDTAQQYAPVAREPIKHYEKGKPVRLIMPGALRAAIFAAYGDPSKPDVLVGVNRKLAPHAHWLEYGNSRISPQPYMRPALSQMRSRCVSLIADGYRTLLIDNGSISPPSVGGLVPLPSVTSERIQQVRQRAAQRWANRK